MKRIVLLIFTAIIITLLTPQRAVIDSNHYQGDIWEEATLTAPFDIPIYKSASSIEAERENIINNFQPVFRIDTSVIQEQISSFITFIQHQNFAPSVIDTVERFLHSVSKIGIIPPADAVQYQDKIIRISDFDNNLVSVPTVELWTPEDIAGKLKSLGVEYSFIYDYIRPNLKYDDQLNRDLRNEELSSISVTRSMIRTGETIVQQGQVIDDYTSRVIESYLREYETKVGLGQGLYDLYLGRFIIILVVLAINYYFLSQYVKKHFGDKLKPWLFTSSLYLFMALLTLLVISIKELNPYLIPLPVVAIYMLSYFNVRVATIGNLSIAIICSLFVRIPFDFFLVNFVAGMVAIFALRHQYHRYNIIKAMGLILLSQILVYFGVSLLREADIASVNYYTIGWFVLNVFLILGFYQAVYIVEKMFGFISDLTLLELCDTNQPLLMKLAEKAPGTFQHSLQVGNLAEAAAKEIGAHPLLARTGALYHDIGKMENPIFFSENQGNIINPHEHISPIESANIIRQHITKGIEIASKAGLPKQILSFIESHHGTSKMYYFYSEYKELYNEEPDTNIFTYPGPLPVSKEVTICMIADSVEAASHSLSNYDQESIDGLVEKIVDAKIDEGQFVKSELSFAEVDKIKQVLKAKLNNIYHTRIIYPEPEKKMDQKIDF